MYLYILILYKLCKFENSVFKGMKNVSYKCFINLDINIINK